METKLHEDKVFEYIDYSGKELSKREFIQCEFLNCNFTGSDLSNNDFTDCTFKNCNFSLTKFTNTGLKNIQFNGCKILGIDFTVTKNFLFSAGFQASVLDYSTFIQKKMKKTIFKDCSLKEVDFEEADLSQAVFENCEMEGAYFMKTNLEKADFRTARNYSLDPEKNSIKQARFSRFGALGLLAKYNIDIEM